MQGLVRDWIFGFRERPERFLADWRLRFCFSRRYLHANRDCGRTSPVYPLSAMVACAARSLGSRRKFTVSMDSVNTALTLR